MSSERSRKPRRHADVSILSTPPPPLLLLLPWLAALPTVLIPLPASAAEVLLSGGDALTMRVIGGAGPPPEAVGGGDCFFLYTRRTKNQIDKGRMKVEVRTVSARGGDGRSREVEGEEREWLWTC